MYAWVIALAAWGGVVNYLARVRRGEARMFNFAELIGEIVTSGFVGVLVFWVCEFYKVPSLMSAPLIGIAGHYGARTIWVIERHLERRFGIELDRGDGS
jgi:hypothetical protein